MNNEKSGMMGLREIFTEEYIQLCIKIGRLVRALEKEESEEIRKDLNSSYNLKTHLISHNLHRINKL